MTPAPLPAAELDALEMLTVGAKVTCIRPDALLSLLAEVRASRSRQAGGDEVVWRPIETAPRDGTRIMLGRHGEHPVIGWWWTGDPQFPWRFFDTDGDELNSRMDVHGGFTHWQPWPDWPAAAPPCAGKGNGT